MKRLATILFVTTLSATVFGDSMRSGEVTRISLVDGGTGTIEIDGTKYFFDDSAKVMVGEAQVRQSRLRKGYDVEYSLTYPVGTGAFIDVIRIIGPEGVVHELSQE